MKRILIFSLAYYPNHVSGAEAAIKEITDRINDIEFHMVTLRYDSSLPKVEKIGNVLIHRIGIAKNNPSLQDLGKLPLDLNKPLYQFLAPLKGLALNRKYKYDGVWAMMAHATGVPIAIFNLFSPHTKYLLTLQEGDPIEHIEKTMKPLWPLFTRSFKKAEVVQTISKYLASWAKQRGVSEDKINIVPNGADPKDLKNTFSQEEINIVKEKLGKQKKDVYLINTARLVWQKGNDDTIRALKKLPDNIKLILVGDGPEKNNLENLAKELNLSNRIIFTGWIDRSQVTKYRQAADIFVAPSRSEGLGNAFLSAMASYLPVIATREGGLAEFVIDQETAWTVEKNNPDQISEAVQDILNNPDKVKTITQKARQMVETKYDWDKIAMDMRNKIFTKIT